MSLHLTEIGNHRLARTNHFHATSQLTNSCLRAQGNTLWFTLPAALLILPALASVVRSPLALAHPFVELTPLAPIHS